MPVWLLVLVGSVGLVGTAVTLWLIAPLLEQAGLTGRDLHKEGEPELPKMGGLGLLVGISGGLVAAIGAGGLSARWH